jgi:SNF2 family DNA or RNA helicase
MDVRLAFAYEDTIVDAGSTGGIVSQPDRRRIVARDIVAEREALARLEQAGARAEYDANEGGTIYRVGRDRAARLAIELAAAGWRVSMDDRALRHAGATTVSVRSGVDWFDLDADVDFDGLRVGLPALLAALRRGDRTVALPDGSLGVLPDEWLARYGRLALVGAGTDEGVRFAKGQAALLDALLAAIPSVQVDERFEHARAALRRFDGVRPIDAPAGFRGELREYQREGLGWLEMLRDVGLGGVLADDMGLGKTVQVLALLERRRQEKAGPSLVVVPASIVFNWVQEAARFAPELRVHVHHGAGRHAASSAIADADLVVTTYGTLRRDAIEFRDTEWEYVGLDEAQAVKTAGTATAKSARLLRARHRLAVTGTPVENRLDELWSLFEFLNPGMLGASTAFRRLTGDGASVMAGEADDDGDGIDLIARAVRPYILRRTKGQVARELPERVEQTVWVDLAPDERKAYDELRDHYRASLLGRVATEGLAKSKIHVLEALLRLRQAACHPGLIDRERSGETSGKLEVLLTRLAETTAEGHKTLVFSQFTTLLGIVRERLDTAGVKYEYLDGRTRDRQQRVERFQGDPEVTVFLVSLKAGGVGLNLTAADYVFILDPWWNPAVEAQAIDRAHRIGQANHVFAYRLLTTGTVEEKIAELQRSKRDLADLILQADAGLLRNLKQEDLEILLS